MCIRDSPKTEQEEVRHASENDPFCGLAFKIATDPFVGRLCFCLLYTSPIRLPAGTNLLAELLYGCLHYGFREFPPCAFAACGRSYPHE